MKRIAFGFVSMVALLAGCASSNAPSANQANTLEARREAPRPPPALFSLFKISAPRSENACNGQSCSLARHRDLSIDEVALSSR